MQCDQCCQTVPKINLESLRLRLPARTFWIFYEAHCSTWCRLPDSDSVTIDDKCKQSESGAVRQLTHRLSCQKWRMRRNPTHMQNCWLSEEWRHRTVVERSIFREDQSPGEDYGSSGLTAEPFPVFGTCLHPHCWSFLNHLNRTDIDVPDWFSSMRETERAIEIPKVGFPSLNKLDFFKNPMDS